jgi:alpha-beta hydrolase superfamily lysophospholipase
MSQKGFRRSAALVVTLTLAACAAGAPPPADAIEVLPHRAWLPEQEPEAAVLAVHGFNDYSNAFADFGAYAAGQGIAVHAYDQGGFGANPDAGLWPGTEALVEALRRELDRLSEIHAGRPIYLLGESMGAAVVIAAQAEAPLDVEGTILSAPAVWGGDQLSPLYRATLWVAARVAPGLTLTGEGLDILPSDNIDMLRALGRDPLVIEATRIDAIAGLVALMDVALASADETPGPVLVLRGARDEIVPPAAQAAMLEELTAEPCTEAFYAEGYHMLLRDLQRQVVWKDVIAWIRHEPLPSGLDRPCGGSATSAAASLDRS